jgi:hypothetical protein
VYHVCAAIARTEGNMEASRNLEAGDSRVLHLKQQQSYLRLAIGAGFPSCPSTDGPRDMVLPKFGTKGHRSRSRDPAKEIRRSALIDWEAKRTIHTRDAKREDGPAPYAGQTSTSNDSQDCTLKADGIGDPVKPDLVLARCGVPFLKIHSLANRASLTYRGRGDHA